MAFIVVDMMANYQESCVKGLSDSGTAVKASAAEGTTIKNGNSITVTYEAAGGLGEGAFYYRQDQTTPLATFSALNWCVGNLENTLLVPQAVDAARMTDVARALNR